MGFNMEAIELPGMDIGGLGKVEFELAKLKTNTIQNWQPNKEYKVGDVARIYESSEEETIELLCKCTTAHTSSDTPNWEYWPLIKTGLAYASEYLLAPDGGYSAADIVNLSHIKEWQPNTDYEVGDIIGRCLIEGLKDEYDKTIFEWPLELLFVCNTAHTSSDTFDLGYWTRLTVSNAFYAQRLQDSESSVTTAAEVRNAVNKINSIETQLTGVEELLGGI